MVSVTPSGFPVRDGSVYRGSAIAPPPACNPSLLRSFHFAMARRVTGYRGVPPPIFLMDTLNIEGRLGGTITIKLKNGRVIGSDKKTDHTFTVNYNGLIAEYIKY